MYFDQLIASHHSERPEGITSICSAHPWVLKTAAQRNEKPLLIEATCNQVNQFGGYTGMTPADFKKYIKDIAAQNQYPPDNLILGGDHLGPSVWQHEPAKIAMEKSEVLIHDYVRAGFRKIHLDCSMRLDDDRKGPLDVEVSAQRAARLAKIAVTAAEQEIRFVIGTEVPIPGGAKEHEDGVEVTAIENVEQTIDSTRKAFVKSGLEMVWDKVVAVVVQPGVEFGDDFVLPFDPPAARELSKYIESKNLVYEAHSTDYQTQTALKSLVDNHFAILKVGPALTFAFREAVFALAMIENELIREEERSGLIDIVDKVMTDKPRYWTDYYKGDKDQKRIKRKYSYSDRIRYYWTSASVQNALKTMRMNLGEIVIPDTLRRQFAPDYYAKDEQSPTIVSADGIIQFKINKELNKYSFAT